MNVLTVLEEINILFNRKKTIENLISLITVCDLQSKGQLPSGASKMPVYDMMYCNKEAIGKMVLKNEFNMIKYLQDDKYIVKLYNTFDNFEKLNFIKPTFQSALLCNFIIMEKLNPIHLYRIYVNSEKEINEYSFNKSDEDIYTIETYIITKRKLIIMLQIANIIKYIHSKKILYGDIKQENMGYDNNGKIKFYDFGESTKITNTEKISSYELPQQQVEIIALDKLFIDIISEKMIFAPGREYNTNYLVLSVDEYVWIKSKLYFTDNYNNNYINDIYLLDKLILKDTDYQTVFNNIITFLETSINSNNFEN